MIPQDIGKHSKSESSGIVRWLLSIYRKAPMPIAGVFLPVIFLLVVFLPLQALGAILDFVPESHFTKPDFHLSFRPKAMIVLAGLLTVLGSVIGGGLAKWVYRSLTSRSLLVIHLLVVAGALLVCRSKIRKVIPALAHPQDGDNVWVLSYLTLWLLMVGYMLKAPWDEARDRVDQWLNKVAAPK